MYKWIEVDLDAIASNYQEVRRLVKEDTKILGVVKADAYGHGIVQVAKELERQGADYLGVTEIVEGIQLREAGINLPILIFSPILPEDIYYLKEYELTISLANLELVHLLMEEEIPVKCHIKLETGLGRTGIKFDELDKLVELLQKATNLEIEGIYTHLATAMWSNTSYALKQSKNFSEAVNYLESKGIEASIKHICNSAAIMKFPQMHLDMVRAGTILYGQEATDNSEINLTDAWNLKGQITYINELPRGSAIGYERAYTLQRDTTTAIVPIGFAHGFSVEPVPRPKKIIDLLKVILKNVLRFFNNSRVKTYVQIKERKAPVLGKVGMQLTIIDITDIPDVQVGDIVILPGRRTNISTAIPKVYMKSGKPVKIQRITEQYEDFTMAAK